MNWKIAFSFYHSTWRCSMLYSPLQKSQYIKTFLEQTTWDTFIKIIEVIQRNVKKWNLRSFFESLRTNRLMLHLIPIYNTYFVPRFSYYSALRILQHSHRHKMKITEIKRDILTCFKTTGSWKHYFLHFLLSSKLPRTDLFKLRIQWRLSTILKTSKKLYEIMFFDM